MLLVGYLSQEELDKSTMTTESTSLPVNRVNGIVDTNIQTNIIASGKINPEARFPIKSGVMFDKPKGLTGRKSGKNKDKDEEEEEEEEEEEGENRQTVKVTGPTDDEDLNDGSGSGVEDNRDPDMEARD